ncbi:MAG: SDR family oxidoreductase [Desulfobacterales bacterium]|nr:SDR family oxidoreductase [Desulfobacterales bacterium]
MMQFTGRKALLVGGSCGLALALAPLLLENGMAVTLSCRSEDAGQRIDAVLERYKGWDRVFFSLNSADGDGTASLEAHFKEKGPDYLVDFSHGHLEGLVASISAEKASDYFESNITGRSALLTWATRQMMARRFGRLVYLSSTAAALAGQGQGHYAASKLASEALYRSVGVEMGRRGITTAIVRPGYVAAGRALSFVSENEAWVKKRVPLGRMISPLEVAETLLFLLSDSAHTINASVVSVDGGLTACK